MCTWPSNTPISSSKSVSPVIPDSYVGAGTRALTAPSPTTNSTYNNRSSLSQFNLSYPVPPGDVYVVADSANLFSGAQMVDGKRNMDIKVNLASLLPYIDDGRPIKQRVVVASFPDRGNRMWRYFEQRRYQIYVRPEVTQVDDELAAQVCNILSHAAEAPHRLLVFVTGDGNAHKGQHSFPQLLVLALQHDWSCEVICWKACLNPIYETLENDFPGRMRLRYMDDVRNDLTFVTPRNGRGDSSLYQPQPYPYCHHDPQGLRELRNHNQLLPVTNFNMTNSPFIDNNANIKSNSNPYMKFLYLPTSHPIGFPRGHPYVAREPEESVNLEDAMYLSSSNPAYLAPEFSGITTGVSPGSWEQSYEGRPSAYQPYPASYYPTPPALRRPSHTLSSSAHYPISIPPRIRKSSTTSAVSTDTSPQTATTTISNTTAPVHLSPPPPGLTRTWSNNSNSNAPRGLAAVGKTDSLNSIASNDSGGSNGCRTGEMLWTPSSTSNTNNTSSATNAEADFPSLAALSLHVPVTETNPGQSAGIGMSKSRWGPLTSTESMFQYEGRPQMGRYAMRTHTYNLDPPSDLPSNPPSPVFPLPSSKGTTMSPTADISAMTAAPATTTNTVDPSVRTSSPHHPIPKLYTTSSMISSSRPSPYRLVKQESLTMPTF